MLRSDGEVFFQSDHWPLALGALAAVVVAMVSAPPVRRWSAGRKREVVLRLLRLFWDGLYRAPREVLWFCGVAMAWIVLQMDFTGRLMRALGHPGRVHLHAALGIRGAGHAGGRDDLPA